MSARTPVPFLFHCISLISLSPLLPLSALSQVLMMGGKDEASGTYFNDVWTIEPGTDTMTLVNENAGWNPRHKHCVIRALNSDTIYVIGGVSAGDVFEQDMWRSTDYGVTFTKIDDLTGQVPGGPAKCISTAENEVLMFIENSIEGIARMKITAPTAAALPFTWTHIQSTGCAGDQPDFNRQGISLTFMPKNRKIMLGGGFFFSAFGTTAHNDMWSSVDDGACFTKMSSGVNTNGFSNSALVVLPRENGDEGLLLLVGSSCPSTSDCASENEQHYSMDLGATWNTVADLSMVGSAGSSTWSSDSAPSVVVDTIFERIILGGGAEIFSASLTTSPFHCVANCAVRHHIVITSSSVSVFGSVSVSFLNNLTFYLSPLSSPPSLSSPYLPSLLLSSSCSTRQFETRRRRLGLEWSELNGMEM